MAARTRAGIELVGSVLRYAALEADGRALRLLRLGRCDFDFDAAALVLQEEAGEKLDTVAGAIGDVFADGDITHFHVVLHPPASTVFFTPISAGVPPTTRNEQLHWEAGQFLDADPEAFKIIVHPVRSEEDAELGPVDWFCVTALRRHVYDNFTTLMEKIDAQIVSHYTGGVRAASEVICRFSVDAHRKSSVLAIGQYADHYEYTLCRNNNWYTSCYAPGKVRGDVAYAAVQMLDRLDVPIESVDQLLLYGPHLDEAAVSDVERLVNGRPERLNPFQAINIDTGKVQEKFSYWEYVPSIGVTL